MVWLYFPPIPQGGGNIFSPPSMDTYHIAVTVPASIEKYGREGGDLCWYMYSTCISLWFSRKYLRGWTLTAVIGLILRCAPAASPSPSASSTSSLSTHFQAAASLPRFHPKAGSQPFNLSPVSTTPVNNLSPVSTTPTHSLANISANFLENLKWPQGNTHRPWRHKFMKKTWSRKSRVRLPFNCLQPFWSTQKGQG